MSTESLREEALHMIVMMLRNEPAVEGAFLGGSLANEDKDEYADIDLGIAAGGSDDALNAAWALRDRIVRLVGTPAHLAKTQLGSLPDGCGAVSKNAVCADWS